MSAGAYETRTWFERDRAWVALVTKEDEAEVASWWDEGVYQLIEDGFLYPGRDNYLTSAHEYAAHLGLIKK